MNWGLGFRRLSYAFLALVWITTTVVQAVSLLDGSGTPGSVGSNFGMVLAFSFGWLLLHAAISWVARGFTSSSR